eukprot:9482442-Pyramimonas_sp.AAC.1
MREVNSPSQRVNSPPWRVDFTRAGGEFAAVEGELYACGRRIHLGVHHDVHRLVHVTLVVHVHVTHLSSVHRRRSATSGGCPMRYVAAYSQGICSLIHCRSSVKASSTVRLFRTPSLDENYAALCSLAVGWNRFSG